MLSAGDRPEALCRSRRFKRVVEVVGGLRVIGPSLRQLPEFRSTFSRVGVISPDPTSTERGKQAGGKQPWSPSALKVHRWIELRPATVAPPERVAPRDGLE